MISLFSVEASAEKKSASLCLLKTFAITNPKTALLNQLKENGFGEAAAKYTIENAGGSKAKAAELAQKFAEAKMNLIFTIGTSATIPVSKAIKDVPIVFCTVYDPAEAGIAKDWKSSGNNTTGSTTKFPMSKIVNSLERFCACKEAGCALYTW